MVDKEANKELRIKHYENYKALLDKSKIKNNSEMARKTGIHPTVFTDWKQGVSEPKMDKITLIAKALKVSPSKIIGG